MTIEQIVAKVLHVEPGVLDDTSSRDTIEAWDSMAHLTLVMELEGYFQISIAIADALDMVDVGKIKEILPRYGVHC